MFRRIDSFFFVAKAANLVCPPGSPVDGDAKDAGKWWSALPTPTPPRYPGTLFFVFLYLLIFMPVNYIILSNFQFAYNVRFQEAS